jgi:hypothetical protein
MSLASDVAIIHSEFSQSWLVHERCISITLVRDIASPKL